MLASLKTLALLVPRTRYSGGNRRARNVISALANRRIHRGYIRIARITSIVGLVGDTLHGETAGIVGTGRIGAALRQPGAKACMHVLGADSNMSSCR